MEKSDTCGIQPQNFLFFVLTPYNKTCLHFKQHKRSNISANSVSRYLCDNADGPHGAPSSSIFTAEHAILVATGKECIFSS